MKEEELRIGTIAFYGKQLWVVSQEDFNSTKTDFKEAEPMPLTKEMAMEFNVDWQKLKDEEGTLYFDIKNIRIYLCNDSVSLHLISSGRDWFPKIMDIPYVHTFQNLILDLTGLVIELKPSTAQV